MKCFGSDAVIHQYFVPLTTHFDMCARAYAWWTLSNEHRRNAFSLLTIWLTNCPCQEDVCTAPLLAVGQ